MTKKFQIFKVLDKNTQPKKGDGSNITQEALK
jgi:hypothetical protein